MSLSRIQAIRADKTSDMVLQLENVDFIRPMRFEEISSCYESANNIASLLKEKREVFFAASSVNKRFSLVVAKLYWNDKNNRFCLDVFSSKERKGEVQRPCAQLEMTASATEFSVADTSILIVGFGVSCLSFVGTAFEDVKSVFSVNKAAVEIVDRAPFANIFGTEPEFYQDHAMNPWIFSDAGFIKSNFYDFARVFEEFVFLEQLSLKEGLICDALLSEPVPLFTTAVVLRVFISNALRSFSDDNPTYKSIKQWCLNINMVHFVLLLACKALLAFAKDGAWTAALTDDAIHRTLALFKVRSIRVENAFFRGVVDAQCDTLSVLLVNYMLKFLGDNKPTKGFEKREELVLGTSFGIPHLIHLETRVNEDGDRFIFRVVVENPVTNMEMLSPRVKETHPVFSTVVVDNVLGECSDVLSGNLPRALYGDFNAKTKIAVEAVMTSLFRLSSLFKCMSIRAAFVPPSLFFNSQVNAVHPPLLIGTPSALDQIRVLAPWMIVALSRMFGCKDAVKKPSLPATSSKNQTRQKLKHIDSLTKRLEGLQSKLEKCKKETEKRRDGIVSSKSLRIKPRKLKELELFEKKLAIINKAVDETTVRLKGKIAAYLSETLGSLESDSDEEEEEDTDDDEENEGVDEEKVDDEEEEEEEIEEVSEEEERIDPVFLNLSESETKLVDLVLQIIGYLESVRLIKEGRAQFQPFHQFLFDSEMGKLSRLFSRNKCSVETWLPVDAKSPRVYILMSLKVIRDFSIIRRTEGIAEMVKDMKLRFIRTMPQKEVIATVSAFLAKIELSLNKREINHRSTAPGTITMVCSNHENVLRCHRTEELGACAIVDADPGLEWDIDTALEDLNVTCSQLKQDYHAKHLLRQTQQLAHSIDDLVLPISTPLKSFVRPPVVSVVVMNRHSAVIARSTIGLGAKAQYRRSKTIAWKNMVCAEIRTPSKPNSSISDLYHLPFAGIATLGSVNSKILFGVKATNVYLKQWVLNVLSETDEDGPGAFYTFQDAASSAEAEADAEAGAGAASYEEEDATVKIFKQCARKEWEDVIDGLGPRLSLPDLQCLLFLLRMSSTNKTLLVRELLTGIVRSLEPDLIDDDGDTEGPISIPGSGMLRPFKCQNLHEWVLEKHDFSGEIVSFDPLRRMAVQWAVLNQVSLESETLDRRVLEFRIVMFLLQQTLPFRIRIIRGDVGVSLETLDDPLLRPTFLAEVNFGRIHEKDVLLFSKKALEVISTVFTAGRGAFIYQSSDVMHAALDAIITEVKDMRWKHLITRDVTVGTINELEWMQKDVAA